MEAGGKNTYTNLCRKGNKNYLNRMRMFTSYNNEPMKRNSDIHKCIFNLIPCILIKFSRAYLRTTVRAWATQ